MSQPPYDIIGLGVSTVDLSMVVEEFPAQEGVQQAQTVQMQGGGPVATAMAAAARLGSKTAMIDSIGDDSRGQFIVNELKSLGVETRFMQVASAAAALKAEKLGGRGLLPTMADVATFLATRGVMLL